GLVLIGFASSACSDKSNPSEIVEEQYPLNNFKLKVGGSYYHGNIDQENHVIEIGGIVDGNTITAVEYSLKNGNTTISTDPSSFMGGWKQEQSVVITNDDNTQTTYTIRFTKLKESDSNILFMDDFDVNGIPDTD